MPDTRLISVAADRALSEESVRERRRDGSTADLLLARLGGAATARRLPTAVLASLLRVDADREKVLKPLASMEIR